MLDRGTKMVMAIPKEQKQRGYLVSGLCLLDIKQYLCYSVFGCCRSCALHNFGGLDSCGLL